MALEWCSAKTAAHRSHLSVFRCADPEHSHYDEELEVEEHDFPYEIEVQEHVNGLTVPAYAPSFLLLGYEDGRLAAVLELRVQHLDDYCFIKTVAVANWAQRRGYGRDSLRLVPLVMSKYGISSFTVEAHVDRDNYRSQDLFESEGYHYVEMRDGYQVWARAFS